MLMELIGAEEMNVLSVCRSVVRCLHLKFRCGAEDRNVGRKFAAAKVDLVRHGLLRHADRFIENLTRLIFLRGDRITLSAGFTIIREHVQCDARHECGLAILTRDLNVRTSETSESIRRLLETEKIGENEYLPRCQHERIAKSTARSRAPFS